MLWILKFWQEFTWIFYITLWFTAHAGDFLFTMSASKQHNATAPADGSTSGLLDHTSMLDLKTSLESAHKSIEDLSLQVRRLTDTVVNCERKIQDLQFANGELREFSNALQESIINVDLASRKKNLVITGIQEVLNESSEILCAYLYDMFVEFIDTLELSDFDLAYRIGSPGAFRSRPRPILVKFVRESVRDSIAAIRAQLSDEDTNDRVFVNNDLPKTLSERQSEFRMIQKLAKESKIPVKISGNKICVNNITYDHTNLDCLPTGLRLEDARIKAYNGTLAFYSKYAWLSNFFPCPVKIQGVMFTSAEQAYQYVRARRNNSPELAAIILRSSTAAAAKSAGKGVDLLPNWDDDKEPIMKRILESKFALNPDLAAKLIATGNSQLVEATTDKFWGAHATINSKAIKTSTWEGLNKLGSLLMECREELNREAAWHTFTSSPDDSMYRPYETANTGNLLTDKGCPSNNVSMTQVQGTQNSSQTTDPTPEVPPRRRNTSGRGRGATAIQHPAYSQQQPFSYSVMATRGSRPQRSRGNKRGNRGSSRGFYPNVQTRSQQVKRPVTSPETSNPCPSKQRTASDTEDLFAVPSSNSGQSSRLGFHGESSSSQHHHVDDSVVIGSQVI